MLTQTRMAYDGHWNAVRKDWMTKWPGQIVQTVTRMTWTKDVSIVDTYPHTKTPTQPHQNTHTHRHAPTLNIQKTS